MQTFDTIAGLFARVAEQNPERPFLHYFGRSLSYGEVDAASDSLAAALQDAGFAKGDRLACYMQNIPQFLIVAVASWKLGGVLVSINPMNRARELSLILDDSTPHAMVIESALVDASYRKLPDETFRPPLLICVDPADYAVEAPPGLFPQRHGSQDGFRDLAEVLRHGAGRRPAAVPLAPADVASLVYTSGTTGKPKGAIGTQGGLALGARLAREAEALPAGVVSLVVAPMFHIAGLIMSAGSTLDAGGSLVLSYRFDPTMVAGEIARYRPTALAGAVTIFIALMNAPAAAPLLAGIEQVYSGGAPVPASVVDQYEALTGRRLRTSYGLTETTGAAFIEPEGCERRIDPATGTLSVGTPLPTFGVSIIDETGTPLPARVIGEVVLSGPAISPGYWNNREASEDAMRPDGLRTGDVGFLDEDGWLYLVDRMKDVIIAAGYKVWPREVEDVLYMHPAVREAAVIGLPDPYRGETVQAYISLKGTSARVEPADLVAFCKERLAAYKYPRQITIMADLPKSPAGKILRRELR